MTSSRPRCCRRRPDAGPTRRPRASDPAERLEAVAQREGTTLEARTPRVGATVLQAEPAEGPAGAVIPDRRPSAGKIRQEHEAAGAGCDGAGLLDELGEGPALPEQGPREPLERRS